MSLKKYGIFVFVLIGLALTQRADACSIYYREAGIFYPADAALEVPTNGIIRLFSALGVPASVALTDSRGKSIPVSLVGEKGDSDSSEYLYRADAELAMHAVYRLKVDFGPDYDEGPAGISFTTGVGPDAQSPYMLGFQEAGITYYDTGEVFEYYDSGMCGAYEVVLAQVDPEFQEELRRNGRPLDAHYKIAVRLKPFSNEEDLVFVSMLRQEGGGFNVEQSYWLSPEHASYFEASLPESQGSSQVVYRFKAGDIFGNETHNLGEVVFSLDRGSSKLLSSTLNLDPLPPTQPIPPVADSASGGCSLSGSATSTYSAISFLALTLVWFLTLHTLKRNDYEND